MARKPREKSSSGIYHVLMQGVRRGQVFMDDEDYMYFIGILERLMFKETEDENGDGEAQRVRNYTLYAYCLMPDYFQLLVKEGEETVSNLVRRIASSYAVYFNGKYDRDGAIYRGRFASEPVETADRFDTVVRYIHQTPLREGKVTDLNELTYSSWYDYVHKGRELPALCEVKEEYRLEDSAKVEEILSKHIEKGVKCLAPRKTSVRLSDKQVQEGIKALVGDCGRAVFMHLSYGRQRTVLLELREKGASLRQLERLTGVGRNVIWRMK